MSENESTERKQVFMGNIKKCPNCGAQITSDTAKCPSCGFVIEKENVSSAMDEFAQKFMSFTTDKEKRDFVESYPIPNNKEDIRGFLNYAANQRDKDYPTKMAKVFWTDAWNNKCRLIVNQAFDVFGADAEFTQYLRGYKKEVEDSSAQNKKLKNSMRFAKIAKVSAIAVVVLTAVGVGGFFKISADKERAEKIAGCIVPKENVSICGFEKPKDWTDKKPALEILSDAKVETVAISQRVETDEYEAKPVWCLDTKVTVDIHTTGDIYEKILEISKKTWPDYYKSSDFLSTNAAWFRTYDDCIESIYHSKNVRKHNFDNVCAVAEKLMKLGNDKNCTLEIRLTQIAGSKKECEDLAIKLHESGKFEFTWNTYYDQYSSYWKKEQDKKSENK
jgi:hypothetical protein